MPNRSRKPATSKPARAARRAADETPLAPVDPDRQDTSEAERLAGLVPDDEDPHASFRRYGDDGGVQPDAVEAPKSILTSAAPAAAEATQGLALREAADRPMIFTQQSDSRRDVPMSEVVRLDDPISNILGDDVWATNYWPGEFEREPGTWRYVSGARMEFTRFYPQTRVLIDKFPKESPAVAREIAEKSARLRAFNAAEPGRQMGYVPMIVDATLDPDDLARARRGELLELHAEVGRTVAYA